MRSRYARGMVNTHGTAGYGDTLRMRAGESRDAHSADFFDGTGTMQGYANATTDRPLLRILWQDGKETEVVESQVEVVERRDDVVNPPASYQSLQMQNGLFTAYFKRGTASVDSTPIAFDADGKFPERLTRPDGLYVLIGIDRGENSATYDYVESRDNA